MSDDGDRLFPQPAKIHQPGSSPPNHPHYSIYTHHHSKIIIDPSAVSHAFTYGISKADNSAYNKSDDSTYFNLFFHAIYYFHSDSYIDLPPKK